MPNVRQGDTVTDTGEMRRLTVGLTTAALVCLAAMTPATAVPLRPEAVQPTSATVSRVIWAAGVQQFLQCRGSKSGATVVLIAGLDSSSSNPKSGWLDVTPRIAGATRVCRYDRPGLGRSPRRGSQVTLTPLQHAHELDALLRAAGETGPYLLVGHSYGGLVARAFAMRYMVRTAGVLLVDSAWAGQGQSDGYRWPEPDKGANRAIIDMQRTSELLGGRPHLNGRPLIVITAGIDNTANWMSHQVSMSHLSSNSVHLIAPGSAHEVQHYRPALIERAIRDLLSAIRSPVGSSRHRLRSCASNSAHWSAVRGTCA